MVRIQGTVDADSHQLQADQRRCRRPPSHGMIDIVRISWLRNQLAHCSLSEVFKKKTETMMINSSFPDKRGGDEHQDAADLRHDE